MDDGGLLEEPLESSTTVSKTICFIDLQITNCKKQKTLRPEFIVVTWHLN